MEHLPVADNTVDVIISNCVINLSPSKPDVLREAFRVLSMRPRDESRAFIKDWMPGAGIENYVVSATIEATKPGLGVPYDCLRPLGLSDVSSGGGTT